ncbi:MAG: hypothetical protein US31_C0021G0005 [Berkelbacteria bacterium GW2011_GWA1_36_9]|uniref:Restriction endonuclease type II-like domain-containing protein n=1 Tax=Berkelbacteria bacterium GW2011_GWA1_36_9 TaxID=1618331 RepID=A0A0G0FTL2_9BACT|nr:MAG: hypothetical protein US31_C0021G0005 [Berkelbacteria bacterium GW2011_GWA1_36_9]
MPESFANIVTGCAYCGKPLVTGYKFCSRECKSKSQVIRIMLKCFGCNKKFKLSPCCKRKTNYCSMKCYWDSTRLKKIRRCKVCDKEFVAKNSLIVKGFGIFCSRKCQHKTYPKQIKKICLWCNKAYFVPPSQAVHRNFCSKKCHDDSRRDYVTKICKKCNQSFDMPRSELNRGFGRGSFCSFDCHMHFRGESSLEEIMKNSLDKLKVDYEREVKFERFRVDFLIEKYKTVIECDGEFWHLRPYIRERDKRKDTLLQSLGYKVIRYTGNDLSKLDEDRLSRVLLKKFNS